MPELPEVETVRLGLSKLLLGHKIISISVENPKSFLSAKADISNFLINAKVVSIRRRAKILLIDLDTRYSLVIHLKMTGQLVYVHDDASKRFGAGHPNKSLIEKLPDKSTRVSLELDSATLYFNDQRKFGWMRLVPTLEIENLDFYKKLGPEPLSSDFTARKFIARIKKRKNTRIKPALLDQTVIAGVGNIYADECLWGAKINPTSRVHALDEPQLKLLFKELQYVLRTAIKKGGSTDKNYVNAEGKAGSYLSFARVFRREGLACPRCGTIIEKIRVAGRGTHFCPTCQKSQT